MGDDGMLHLAAASAGMPEAVLAIIQTIPVGKGMAGLAVERRQAVNACNIQTDTSGDVRPGARATAMAGAVVVPIFRGEDVIGALWSSQSVRADVHGRGNRGSAGSRPGICGSDIGRATEKRASRQAAAKSIH